MLNSTMIVDLKFHSYLRILLLIKNTVRFTNYKKMHILQQKQHQVLLFTCYLFLCNIGGWVCQKKTILINVLNASQNKTKAKTNKNMK